MRPSVPLIERLQALWPQGQWAAYPEKPDPFCWVSGPARPTIHMGKGKGYKPHPVAAFFMHLGAPRGAFKLRTLCRNPLCANPYHFGYDYLTPHEPGDALEFAVTNDELTPSGLIEIMKGKTFGEFLELAEGEMTEEEVYSLYFGRPQDFILEVRAHSRRKLSFGRRSFCTLERAQAAQLQWQSELPPNHKVILRPSMMQNLSI